MIFSKLLEIASAFLRIGTVKSSSAKSAGENTQAEDSGISASALSASESRTSLEVRLITETKAKAKLVDWCKSQIGYHEGYDGSNKYADGNWDVKLYGFSAISVPWCDVFADAAFISCFGYDSAVKMTYQTPSGYAACTLSADAYRRHGAFTRYPAVGDQIFFDFGGGINHTGIVVEVYDDHIVCVEGNYSDSVQRTQYKKSDPTIAGYGRPNWSVVSESDTVESAKLDDIEEIDQFDIIHDEHPTTYLHLEYGDGVTSHGYEPLPQVAAWQNLLLCWGYDLGKGGADGEYGLDTENATRQWQQYVQTNLDANVEVNGVVDEDDWEAIIKFPG